MDCFVPDDANSVKNQALFRHLENCSDCALEWEKRSQLGARLKTAVERQYVPSDLQTRVRERLERRKHGSWWQIEWIRWTIPAAASLAIAVALWTNYRPTSMPGLSDRPAQNIYIQKISATLSPVLKLGLGDHVHCAIFRKYPANPPTASQMLSDLGPSYQDLLDLVKANISNEYRVVMAHQCSYAGRKYVHFTLRKGSELVSLVITRKQDGESLPGASPAFTSSGVPLYQAAAEQYKVLSFEAGRYFAFVVSDLPHNANLQIAGKLAPAVHQFLTNLPA
jgi:hypothetical protein